MFRRISTVVARNTISKFNNANNAKQFAPFVAGNLQTVQTQQFNVQKRFTSKVAKGPTVAVVMTGAGFLDGTEITEAVSLMIHLSEKGYNAVFFSPEGDVQEVFDHNTRAVEKNEVRNIFSEVARITRTKTLSIKTLRSKPFDALVIPGGFGAVKTLCNYGDDPKEFTVDPEVARVIKEFYEERKPIAACCIAPVVLAKVLGTAAGGPGITVTLGGDSTVEEHVKALGNEVAQAKINEAVVDSKNRIISTPAYMAKNPASHEIHAGIGEMVAEIVKLSRGAQQASQTQEVDWDFQDYFHLKIKKIEPKEWEFIKKEMKQKLEDEKKKASTKDRA